MSTNGNTGIWDTWVDKMVDETVNATKRAARRPFLAAHAQRVKKGATPSEVVYEEDRLKLLRYESPGGGGSLPGATPLIFIFALVNRPYILDLKENKSVVSHFVRAGFDTYLVDWGVPTDSDNQLALDDYINGYML